MSSTPRAVWNWLSAYIAQNRRYLIVALICAIGVSGMSLLVGYLLEPFLDSSNAAGHSISPQAVRRINLISVGIVGIYAVRWFFYYGQTVYFAEAGQRVGLSLRNDIYAHLQGLSLSFFNRQRTGALMSTINNDVPLIQGTISGLKDIAPAPFQILGGLYAIFRVSPQLSVVALFALPLMVYSINRLSRRIRQITASTQDQLAEVNTLMEETLSGMRIIQSFGAEKFAVNRFQRENQAAKDLSMSGIRQAAKLKPTTDVIGAVGIALALWVAGRLMIAHELTIGELGKFIFMLNQIAVGIGGLGAAKVTWEQIQAAGGRIRAHVLEVQTEVKEAPDAVVLASTEGRVEFRNVSFAYNAHTPVLRDVSFTMSPGEVVAVVGPSGAGKSTLADLIPRFYDPSEGKVLVDGHDVCHVTIESLRRQIGIVPQETVLFGGTIRDNIAFGNPTATDAEIEAAACAANAHSFISDPRQLPDGYQTVVGERGKQLSGGQRQRIAIARALLRNPRILILDEATSSLDTESEILVQEALEELMQGRTTLVIAHRLSTVQNAHKILVMQAGRIVESGTHGELVRRPNGLYRRLYETQFHSDSEDPPLP